MRSFDTIFYDIVGVCNAKCAYCHTGRYRTSIGSLVTVDKFTQTIAAIKANKLLNPGGVVGLYNWGEPFLHPKLGELLRVMNDEQLGYGFSTNISRIPTIDANFTAGLKYLILSMPGFSQSSYDRIHGFKFPEMLKNIEIFVTQTRRHGFKGPISIFFHIYQFNLNEIAPCAKFCRDLGVIFSPSYAILNNWWHINAFLEGKLEYPMLERASQELLLFDVKKKAASAPKDYPCPQYNWGVLDEDSNMLLCCQVPTGTEFACGNLLTDDVEKMLAYREDNATCAKCSDSGLAYYLNNSLPVTPFWDGATPAAESHLRVGLRRAARKVRSMLKPATA